MGEDEFWDSTPRYFAARQKGWMDARVERFEIARTVAFFAITPHLKKGAIQKPSDLWPLPTDPAPEKPKIPSQIVKPSQKDIDLLKKLHEQLGKPIPAKD